MRAPGDEVDEEDLLSADDEADTPPLPAFTYPDPNIHVAAAVPPPDVTIPEGVQAVSPPVTAPGAIPVAVPMQAPRPPVRWQDEAEQEQLRRIAYAYQDEPIAQAERAVSTAMKFQAIRGYQRDMSEGMSNADALAKWAPVMFSQPKAATLGQAASMVRQTRPALPKIMDVGGVAYEISGGQARALTPPKAFAPKAVPVNRFDLQEHAGLLKQIQAIQKELPGTPLEDRGDLIRELRRLQTKADEVRLRTNAPAPAAPGGRVKVRRPDGKFGTIPASQLDAALRQGYTRQ